jgi:hypothetical protein
VIPASPVPQAQQVRSAQQAQQAPRDPLDLGDPRDLPEIPHKGEGRGQLGNGGVVRTPTCPNLQTEGPSNLNLQVGIALRQQPEFDNDRCRAR